MKTLLLPVGLNGHNRKEDVLTVQTLLNENRDRMGFLQLPRPTGYIDPVTFQTIKEFQIRVVGMFSPSGRVEPDSMTLYALNRYPIEQTDQYRLAKVALQM